MTESNDKQSLHSDALAWMREMEFIENDYFLNSLILNIRKVPYVKHIEIITQKVSRQMLIYLELNWWGKTFKEAKIAEIVLNMMTEALPSYNFRVIYDKELLAKAEERIKKIVEKSDNEA